jgi:two-component system, chemotaxis family, chemotaxis protein CheY
MNVLIVDDSEPMRRVIKNFINGLTDDIFECSDGSEALDAYREHRPDIVLMDLMMNRIDGLAATRQIRKFCPEARIVIVSQWVDPSLREAALSAGAEDSVSKADLLPLRRILSGAA